MITCDGCQLWTLGSERDEPRCPKGFGICASEHFIRTYSGEANGPDDAVVEPDEGWGIFTGPKFGCIHAVKRHDA